ncbi:MAG: YqaJ viral recombinase family protein [Candidimonas sp.]|nr:YqaJ viral recombinase family protein [Candidimonas sp.]
MSDIQNLLAALPQAPVINQEHAGRWLEGVMRYHRARAEWHAKRLYGIGGSEMGAVLRGLNGLKEAGFGSFRTVVEHKLMMRLPEYETVHMKRGTILEPLARLAFMYRYKAAQDSAAIQRVESATARPGYEWLVGNPDDLVGLSGKRFLVDYKVPSQCDEEIAFDYQVQLHHYDLMCQMAGVKTDGLILAKLDLSPELANGLVERFPTMSVAQVHEVAQSIAKIDMPGMRVVGLVVDKSRSMQLDILEGGGAAWNDFVLAGNVPPKPCEQLVELDDQRMLEVGRLQQQYAMAKAGIKYLTEQCKSIEAGIESTLDGVDIADKALPLSLVKVLPKGIDKDAVIQEAKARGATPQEISDEPVYSMTALLEEIKRLNGDPEAEHLFADGKLDAAKAESYLQGLGVDLREFRSSGIALRMSIAKKDKEIGLIFERSAADRFGNWLDENKLAERVVEDDSMEAFDDFDLEAVSGTLHEVFAGAPSAEPNETTNAPKPIRASASMR